MNYAFLWDDKGYGKRHARIMACKASMDRKLAACARVWKRMDERFNGRRNTARKYPPCFPLEGLSSIHRKDIK